MFLPTIVWCGYCKLSVRIEMYPSSKEAAGLPDSFLLWPHGRRNPPILSLYWRSPALIFGHLLFYFQLSNVCNSISLLYKFPRGNIHSAYYLISTMHSFSIPQSLILLTSSSSKILWLVKKVQFVFWLLGIVWFNCTRTKEMTKEKPLMKSCSVKSRKKGFNLKLWSTGALLLRCVLILKLCRLCFWCFFFFFFVNLQNFPGKDFFQICKKAAAVILFESLKAPDMDFYFPFIITYAYRKMAEADGSSSPDWLWNFVRTVHVN